MKTFKSFISQDGRHEKRTLRLRNGLITRHAYSVTGLARVRGQLGKYCPAGFILFYLRLLNLFPLFIRNHYFVVPSAVR